MNERMTARDEVAEWLALDDVYVYTDFVSAFGERAELLIAHLWERAMEPDVVEEVAKAMYRPTRDKRHAYGVIEQNGMDGTIEGRLEDRNAAKWFLTTTLTALLGPNPNGGSDE